MSPPMTQTGPRGTIAIIRIMRFFCERVLGSLQDMLQEMGMDPDGILMDDRVIDERAAAL